MFDPSTLKNIKDIEEAVRMANFPERGPDLGTHPFGGTSRQHGQPNRLPEHCICGGSNVGGGNAG